MSEPSYLTPDNPDDLDGLDALLAALPPEIAARLRGLPPERDLIEVIMDLGRPPEARFLRDSRASSRRRRCSPSDQADRNCAYSLRTAADCSASCSLRSVHSS
jgi:stage III sporulation protein SpoIIIAA